MIDNNGKLNERDFVRLESSVLYNNPYNGWLDPRGQIWSTKTGFHSGLFSYGLRMKFETAARTQSHMLICFSKRRIPHYFLAIPAKSAYKAAQA